MYLFSVDFLPELAAVHWLHNFALTAASSLEQVFRNVIISHGAFMGSLRLIELQKKGLFFTM